MLDRCRITPEILDYQMKFYPAEDPRQLFPDSPIEVDETTYQHLDKTEYTLIFYKLRDFLLGSHDLYRWAEFNPSYKSILAVDKRDIDSRIKLPQVIQYISGRYLDLEIDKEILYKIPVIHDFQYYSTLATGSATLYYGIKVGSIPLISPVVKEIRLNWRVTDFEGEGEWVEIYPQYGEKFFGEDNQRGQILVITKEGFFTYEAFSAGKLRPLNKDELRDLYEKRLSWSFFGDFESVSVGLSINPHTSLSLTLGKRLRDDYVERMFEGKGESITNSRIELNFIKPGKLFPGFEVHKGFLE
jgi:hypothetical protein